MALESKRDAQYGRGMEKSHCGPSPKWPDGDNPAKTCRHYFKMNVPYPVGACHKVEGRIGSADWCRHWVAKKP